MPATQEKKFKKILIANRGEIAVRAIRACRELDIRVGVIYSRADANALPVKLADEAYFLDRESDIDAYLDQELIVDTAVIHHFDAIYPGYGFLAENARFAALCEKHGVTFIGPSSTVLAAMGDKIEAKRIAAGLGIPLVPGTHAECATCEEGKAEAASIGYPVVIKAAGGGGGRGIRVVHEEGAFAKQFAEAQREARLAFDTACVYVEKFIENPRHVEFQILADVYGTIIHLGERDCSVQRRHQKLIEEAPSQVLTVKKRQEIGNLAKKLMKEVKYTGAATVEFLLDSRKNYYFIEVNPRVQVEHGVTELVTGVDIVQWQIRLAQGEALTLKQQDIQIRGYAIECRINAEDPTQDFTVSSGVIEQYLPPGGNGVRICGGMYVGQEISSQFDTLLVKILAWAETREEAVKRMQRALRECVIEGVLTTIPFHLTVLDNKNFLKGEIDTDFITKNKINQQVRKMVSRLKTPRLWNDNLETRRNREIALVAAAVYKSLKEEMGSSGNGGGSAWVQASRTNT
ncbi:MAG TPA: acetyl-CoA carboxylase biotin carboxylase subunit [bacterium]|nr:acetyl-CoA carboxylase biotin carboxylase subunit [bacterium]